ncbi:MAG TPA: S8 family serine peptidase [Pyrinomonadaceae bacterium]|jgi:subtilisin family serine protease
MSLTKLTTCLLAALLLGHAAPRAARAQAARTDGAKLGHAAAQTRAPQGFVAGELLVQFADEKAMRAAHVARAAAGATVLREFEFAPWQHVRLPAGADFSRALARFRRLPGVVAAQPNFVYQLADTTPNDPRFAEQYGPLKIQAPLAWDTTTGSASVVVAVVDTGVLYTHADLAANMWRNPGETGTDAQGHDKATNGVDDDADGYADDVYGLDTANNDADPRDDHGHGTHVAGIVGAVGNNGAGVAGVNWTVRLMALKIFNQSGIGSSATAIGALQYVLMMKRRGVDVRVTNNSWGGAPEAPAYDAALRAAFDALGAAGVLNVCAAGNNGANNDTTPFYPAGYDVAALLSVAASDSSDNRAGFSSYGATTVDLAAPGVNILSTVLSGGYGNLSGTSMASPMAAGAAALLAARDPSLSPLSLKASLMNAADVLPQWTGFVRTNGRLNVARALQTSVVCTYNVTPTSASFNASGGAGNSISVTAPAGCDWVARTNAPWLTLNSGADGHGGGALTYTVAQNDGPARTATLFVADQIVNVTQAAAAPPDPTPTPVSAGQVIISEFRMDGPGGAGDQFVELYNNTAQPVVVSTDDGSAGWALVSATDATGALAALCVIPNGTAIPARAHYLYTPARGFTLPTYGGSTTADATGPAMFSAPAGVPFAGVALFRTAAPANWTAATRLDAVGGTQSAPLLREGAGLAQNFAFASDAQYSWARAQAAGTPQDTDDNAADFQLVSVKGAPLDGVPATLGAPGPENVASPGQRNATVKAALIDPAVASTAPPNRVRDTTANVCGGPNCALGTLTIRRRFKNGTGRIVTRLRFRIVDITTAPAPAGTADLRALTSADETVTTSLGPVTVNGLTLEQQPTQLLGGGLNSSLTVQLPGGTLAPNASVNVQFTLGVQQGGSFRFLVNVEALP